MKSLSKASELTLGTDAIVSARYLPIALSGGNRPSCTQHKGPVRPVHSAYHEKTGQVSEYPHKYIDDTEDVLIKVCVTFQKKWEDLIMMLASTQEAYEVAQGQEESEMTWFSLRNLQSHHQHIWRQSQSCLAAALLFLPVLPDHLAACPQLSSSAHQLTIIPSPNTYKQICQQQKTLKRTHTDHPPDNLHRTYPHPPSIFSPSFHHIKFHFPSPETNTLS